MEIIELQNQNFKELIKDKICLVDFYADWCAPCKMMIPVLEQVKDKIQIIKVNTEKHEQLARGYGVMSIPTLVFTVNGQEKTRKLGFTSKEELEDIISTLN